MKKVVVLATLVLVVAALSFAGGAKSGYLIDKMCGGKPEAAANHPKGCAEKCAGSGFGLVADGKFTPFNEHGNQLSAEFLKNTKQTKGLKVTIEGKEEDGVLKVTSLKDAAE